MGFNEKISPILDLEVEKTTQKKIFCHFSTKKKFSDAKS
nr:hypothetical protein [Mucilaginibacter sp. X5P1]